jgi:hypothetical protein
MAVAKLIGWENSPPNSSGSFLLEELDDFRNSTIEQLATYQRDKMVARDTSRVTALTALIAATEKAIFKCERQILKAKRYLRDIDDEIAKGDGELVYNEDIALMTGDILLSVASVQWWVKKKYDKSLNGPVDAVPEDAAVVSIPAAPDKPWLVPDPRDPEPEQLWYISARYFARQLVKDDSTLLTKRDLLAQKVAKSLDVAGIKKRGGKKPFDPGTVKKALANVKLG